MKFTIVHDRYFDEKNLDPGFVLLSNTWNDYSFTTQYTLFYIPNNRSSPRIQIGTVKILKRGQTDDYKLPIEEDFVALDDNFISLGQSLDYYQRLTELEDEIGKTVLSSLQDAILAHERIESFHNEPGWRKSILRNYDEGDSFFQTATSIVLNSFDRLDTKPLKFHFKMKEWEDDLIFDFTPPTGTRANDSKLPNRLIALIGRNGTGKSTLLSRIARLAHGDAQDRKSDSYIALGKITPENITFPRIITVSYSAFDSFRLPGVDSTRPTQTIPMGLDSVASTERADERAQIVQDILNGRGRYIFCGLRNIGKESKKQLEAEAETPSDGIDRLPTTLLKSLELLAVEFETNVHRIQKNDDAALFDEALSKLASDPSLSAEAQILNTASLLRINIKEKFKSWSTGHKIVMQIVSSLAAHTTKSSLILIDEPETYLHPPLLASLMHSIRYILRKKQAYAIVATHSPVVLQETLVKNVFKIQGNGEDTQVSPPNLETFGENIGTITGEIFGLNSNVTDFYKTLASMVDNYKTLENIESFFEPYGLSAQARAYVISNIARRKK